MSGSTDREPLVIDGSEGEGGGQIVRTALGLSLVTGRPFRIHGVRARRKRPGLLHQHLTAVRAAARIGCAAVEGAELHARAFTFRPGSVEGGDHHFDIGTAGSTTLVLETLLPALWCARGPTRLTLVGGTHNPLAPPFDFVARSLVPILERMGARIAVTLQRPGFHPRGGGELHARVEPARLTPIDLLERGAVRRITARAVVADLPESIGEREIAVVAAKLALPRDATAVERVANGPGNLVSVDVVCEHVTAVFTALGRPGLPAERVASTVVRDVKAWLRADVPVDPWLADQLLVPFALAGGGSFRTTLPTMHTQTNARLIERFLPVAIRIREDGASWLVEVLPTGEHTESR